MSGRSGRRPDEALRRRALELREQGLTFPVIAERLGLTEEAAGRLVRGPRAQTPDAAVRCAGCGREFARRPPPGRKPRAEPLCLACLAQSPGAPLAQRLLAHRLAAGLTQAALASKTGLSVRAVSQAERGGGRPNADTLRRLAAVLGPGLLGGGNSEASEERAGR
jgi:transcriptional regulator with XRE-family HTH domain